MTRPMASVERTSADFGTRLRRAREAQGVSLRHIAESTKLSIRVLEALERNDISLLPGGIFSRAFVRSYAAEIGLDPERTVQDFVAEFPHESVTIGSPHVPPDIDGELLRRRQRSWAAALLIALGIVAAAAFYLLSRR